jgi:hypothetical protein
VSVVAAIPLARNNLFPTEMSIKLVFWHVSSVGLSKRGTLFNQKMIFGGSNLTLFHTRGMGIVVLLFYM